MSRNNFDEDLRVFTLRKPAESAPRPHDIDDTSVDEDPPDLNNSDEEDDDDEEVHVISTPIMKKSTIEKVGGNGKIAEISKESPLKKHNTNTHLTKLAKEDTDDQPEPLKILTWNVNGLQSLIKSFKDKYLIEDPVLAFLHFLDNDANADMVCLQETKIFSKKRLNLLARFEELVSFGWKVYWHHDAESIGCNGVCTFVRTHLAQGARPAILQHPGRCLITYHGAVALINVYVPNGTKGQERHNAKLDFLQQLRELRKELRAEGRRTMVAIAGDFNLAHEDIDAHDPSFWRGVSGFLPDKKEIFDELLADGMIDTFCKDRPSEPRSHLVRQQMAIQERR
ncbi:hypothetical protein HK102_013926, partial [Quaeritorhiza haematococci]